MEPIKVTLLKYEVYMGASVGMARHIKAMSLNDRFNNPNGGFHIHLDGACTEVAVAKHFGIYWNGSVGTFHQKSDLGASIEVRGNNNKDNFLVIRQADIDKCLEADFISVSGKAPNFFIHGWLPCRECIQKKYREHKPGDSYASYWVPPEDLNPMDTFKIEEKT